jgi:hypothetical protein
MSEHVHTEPTIDMQDAGMGDIWDERDEGDVFGFGGALDQRTQPEMDGTTAHARSGKAASDDGEGREETVDVSVGGDQRAQAIRSHSIAVGTREGPGGPRSSRVAAVTVAVPTAAVAAVAEGRGAAALLQNLVTSREASA